VSCGLSELTGRDTDETLEVLAEVTLIREPDVHGDLRKRQIAHLQKFLGPLDATRDDVPMRGQSGGHLELTREVVGAESGDRTQSPQAQTAAEMLLDVIKHGAEPHTRERTVRTAFGLAGRQDVSDELNSQKARKRFRDDIPTGAACSQFVADRQHRGA